MFSCVWIAVLQTCVCSLQEMNKVKFLQGGHIFVLLCVLLCNNYIYVCYCVILTYLCYCVCCVILTYLCVTVCVVV